MREIGEQAGEVATLQNLALLLYEFLNRRDEAIAHIEQAIAIQGEIDYQGNSDGKLAEELKEFLTIMRRGDAIGFKKDGSATIPDRLLHQIVANTIAVRTTDQNRRDEWRAKVEKALQQSQIGTTRKVEIEFLTAILAILDEDTPTLPNNHPYAWVLATIIERIADIAKQRVTVDESTMHAIRAFVNAADWDEAQQLVEKQQAVLFRPEVEALFQQNIDQARAVGDQDTADLLIRHLAILRDCQANGITAAFARLAMAE